MTLPSPSELQAIVERHAKFGPGLFSANHETITLALADIPTLLDAVKELTEAVRLAELGRANAQHSCNEQERISSELRSALIDSRNVGEASEVKLAAMTARCELMEGVIEQFIDSFKQVWMTSAMERAFNAGLEALRDEPTGGGT